MATQKGRNWSSGDIVTAANLQSVERGVSAVAEEYTPTTWANGNTVTAVGLNNIEQGIANASGGSSDFSTATLTIVRNSNYVVYGVPIIITVTISAGDIEVISTDERLDNGDTDVILYRGNAFAEVNYDPSASVITASGAIEQLEEEVGFILYKITGDCIITDGSDGGGGGDVFE